MANKPMILWVATLVATPAFAQDDTRGTGAGNPASDVAGPPSDPGPPEWSGQNDLVPPGQQSGNPEGMYDLNGPGSRGEQLADGTIQIRNDSDAVVGHVLSRLKESDPSPSPTVGSRGMETWVFEPGSIYDGPAALNLEVLTTQNGGVSSTDFWSDLLQAEAGHSLYVCVDVRYVNMSKGNAKSVITPLTKPTVSSYVLTLNGDVVAWLFRGTDATGATGDVYAFIPDYQAPQVGETLVFTPLSQGAQFKSIDSFYSFVNSQGAGFLGIALYSAPLPVAADTTCTW